MNATIYRLTIDRTGLDVPTYLVKTLWWDDAPNHRLHMAARQVVYAPGIEKYSDAKVLTFPKAA